MEASTSSTTTSAEPARIRVVVRKRPLSKKEISKSDPDILEQRGRQAIVLKEIKTKVDLTKYLEEHQFVFDEVFDDSVSNEQLYMEAVQPLVEAAFSGVKVTCFAYGQTGSGKTYTMMGSQKEGGFIPGMFLLAASEIFSKIIQNRWSLCVCVSFYEIYCGKLFDLLNERKVLCAREDGKQNVWIVGLSEKQATSVEELMAMISFGMSARTTGVTGANVDSSRSHAILQISFKQPNGQVFGKISFIDLAGSERGADTIDQNKQTRMDGAEINKSLLALKECIRALDQDKKHTPFRGSKLTLVLRDSFVGNCRTLMIANVSPTQSCCEHTLNTLRYADRVKELKKGAGEKEPGHSGNPEEQLAKALMLARQSSNVTRIAIPKAMPNGVVMAMGNPTVKMPPPMMGQPQVMAPPALPPQQMKRSQTAAYPTPMSMGGVAPPSPRMKAPAPANKNPSIGLNLRNGVEITANSSNIDKLSENLRNISNMIINNNQHSMPMKPVQMPAGLPLAPIQKPISIKPVVPSIPAPVQSEEELQKICGEHDKLVNEILDEEETIISTHKVHIDNMVEMVKQEMQLLQEVDKPGSDIDSYVSSLDSLLALKMSAIAELRGKLGAFREHLTQEHDLSKKFFEQQNELKDVYDLHKNEANPAESGITRMETGEDLLLSGGGDMLSGGEGKEIVGQ